MSRLSDFHGIGPLADRPSAAAAHALRADASHLALSWTDSDTGTLYALNLDGTAWVAIGGGGGGASTFLDLTDTPNSYAGQAGKALRVNAAGTGVDYVNFPAGLDGPTITLAPPELTGNFYHVPILTSPKPSGLLNDTGGDDGVSYRLIQNAGEWTQGPTGHTNYYNTVFAVGFNMTASYTPDNPAMPSGSFRIESKFAQGGATDVFMSEYHMASHFPIDWATPGVGEYRAMTATVPHNSADYNSVHCSIGQRGALHIIWDWAGRQRILYDFTTAVGGVIDYMDGGSGQGHPKLRFNTNNRPAHEQINAAGTSLLPLPYRNAYDNHYFSEGAIYLVTETQLTPAGVSAAMIINCTAGNDGHGGIVVSCPVVAGTFYATQVVGSASDALLQQIYNNGAGVAGIDFQVLNGAGNDCVIGFSNVAGGATFTIGYDNSDGDKLKIEKSYRSVGNASNLFVEFDPTTNTSRFGKPIEFGSSTVAGAPAATGFRHWYFTNALKTGESTGAGTGCPAYSDGTNWRRYSDDTIISA